MTYTIAIGVKRVLVVSIIMLRAAKLVSYRAVSLPGLNPVWKITNPEDVVEIGDKVLAKLNPAKYWLAQPVVCG